MVEPLKQSSDASGARSTEDLVIDVARFLDSKRAEDVVIIDVRELLYITSYFVIASGSSTRLLQSLRSGLKDELKGSPLSPLGVEGERDAHWVCLDYGDVVVHLFMKEAREFYDLDHLWGDAPRVAVEFATDANEVDAANDA